MHISYLQLQSSLRSLPPLVLKQWAFDTRMDGSLKGIVSVISSIQEVCDTVQTVSSQSFSEDAIMTDPSDSHRQVSIFFLKTSCTKDYL